MSKLESGVSCNASFKKTFQFTFKRTGKFPVDWKSEGFVQRFREKKIPVHFQVDWNVGFRMRLPLRRDSSPRRRPVIKEGPSAGKNACSVGAGGSFSNLTTAVRSLVDTSAALEGQFGRNGRLQHASAPQHTDAAGSHPSCKIQFKAPIRSCLIQAGASPS